MFLESTAHDTENQVQAHKFKIGTVLITSVLHNTRVVFWMMKIYQLSVYSMSMNIISSEDSCDIHNLIFCSTIKAELCSGHVSLSLDVQNEIFQKIFSTFMKFKSSSNILQ